MGLRFRKSVKICKGVRVNFSKSGTSLSFGGKGLRTTVRSNGRVTSSVGIPGTGLYYTTSSGGKKRSSSSHKSSNASAIRAQQQAQLQQQKATEAANNAQMVQNYENLLNRIRSIHKTCSDPVDWAYLQNKPAPFDPMGIGPKEALARQNLTNAKPSLLGKLIPSIDKNKLLRLEAAVGTAKQQDTEDYNEWEDLNELSNRILSGDVDSYFYVVSEMHPFDDILEFGSDFEVGTDIADLIEVEFHVKSEQVVPEHTVSLTQTGKLSTKVMTKTMHYDITQDYICSCVIRVAREMFALLPVEKALIHAVDTALNTATGYEEQCTVLSVLIDREHLGNINLEMIDPSDAVSSFPCHMDFKKTQGLKPVSRIEI